MSARLLRRVLKEQEEEKSLGPSGLNPELDAGGGGDEDSDSPVAAAPSKNPFDLLDDQVGAQLSSETRFLDLYLVEMR